MTRLSLAEDFEGWLSEKLGDKMWAVKTVVCGQDFEFGQLNSKTPAFRVAPNAGSALTGALVACGWAPPAIDPHALSLLQELQFRNERVEFVLDTSAFGCGVAQWLILNFEQLATMVVTDVTLREIQEQETAWRNAQTSLKNWQPKEKLSPDENSAKKLEAIHNVLQRSFLYFGGNRCREFSAAHNVAWRELEMEDVALLLSKTAGSSKGAESDTVLLRAARRHIMSQPFARHPVFFVTADTALARRALSELPPESVIACKPATLKSPVIFPHNWTPGPDEGAALASPSVGLLLWELLSLGDQLELSSGERSFTLQAFSRDMWPSDYREPWVDVVHQAGFEDLSYVINQETSVLSLPSHTFSIPSLRIGLPKCLELIASLMRGVVPDYLIKGPIVRKHYQRFLEGIGVLTAENGTLSPVPTEELRAVFATQSSQRLVALMGKWAEFQVFLEGHETRLPQATRDVAKRMAEFLGWDAVWFDKFPLEEAVGVAVEMTTQNDGGLTAAELLRELMSTLHVPIAFIREHEKALVEALSTRFELRRGGSSSGNNVAKFFVPLQSGEFEMIEYDLETLSSYRDMRLK